MNYGLKVLESAFEQLDIKAGNSDSEDEEAIGRVEPILEPKVQKTPCSSSRDHVIGPLYLSNYKLFTVVFQLKFWTVNFLLYIKDQMHINSFRFCIPYCFDYSFLLCLSTSSGFVPGQTSTLPDRVSALHGAG